MFNSLFLGVKLKGSLTNDYTHEEIILSTGIYSPYITHLLHVTDMSRKYMVGD